MSKSSITKARRRLRRNRSLVYPGRVLLLPLVLTFYIYFMLRRHAGSFSVKSYFPGRKIHPAIFNPKSTPEKVQVERFGPLYMLELGSAKTTSNSSITAVLALTEETAETLELTITELLERQSAIQEVVVLCPELLLSTARSTIRHVDTSYGSPLSALLTLLPCAHATCSAYDLIEIASYVSTDWVLFLEDSGLRRVNKAARSLLLNPPAVTFPLGPKGFTLPKSEAHKEVCTTHRPADFLVPPFVLPSYTFSDVHAFPDLTLDSWSALGRWVSDKRPDTIGGVIISGDLAADGCFESHPEAQDASNGQRLSTLPIDNYHSRIFGSEPPFSNAGTRSTQGRFGICFPGLDDLAAFSHVACGLVRGGHRLDIYLYRETDSDQTFISTDTCALHYTSSSSATPAIFPVPSWLSRLSGPLDVLITLTADDVFTASLFPAIRNSEHATSTIIRLPREDLLYSDWMGALSLQEWQSILDLFRL